MSSASSSDVDGPLAARYGGADDDDDDDDGLLSVVSLNISPGKKTNGHMAKAPHYGGPSRRGGRHSAADVSGTGPLTLRDQEQVRSHLRDEADHVAIERCEEGHLQSSAGEPFSKGTAGEYGA